MSLCKFLSSLLLLSLAFCPTTMAQPGIPVRPSPPPPVLPPPPPTPVLPPPPPPLPVLPQEEVDAVNALFQLSKISGANIDVTLTFSRTDCNTLQFRKAIACRCNSTCRVTHIDMSGQTLTGNIPAEIGVLSQLRSLDLSENKLYGSIPSSFANLSQLSGLYLDNNDLGGPLPPFISNMTSLQVLNLYDNWFNESIPPEFGIFPSLQYLSMENNLLSGRIPKELGNISSLIRLFLSDNLLTKQLPPHLGNLSNLRFINLANNEFSGALPSEFGKLKSMTYFNVMGNYISGTPDVISNWPRLRKLILIGNNFEGPLPSNISALINLTYLAAYNLPGSPGGSLLTDISNARNLSFLTLRNCSLTGRIPEKIWQLSYLVYLDLSFNGLIGEIPAVVELPYLKYIFLRRNKLNGSLPGWMLSSNYSFVDVSENLFSTTTIPGNISQNMNLFECCSNISDMDKKWQQVDYHCANKKLRYDHLYINCGGNQTSINGSLYEADSNPDGASTFYLSNNSAWAYSSMGIFLSAKQRDQYLAMETCNISAEDAALYMTARVSPISLKYYGFCLEDDNYIVRLHFAEIGWDITKVRDSGMKSKRVFDVEIQGQKVLTDFNIEEEAGVVRKDVTKEFITYVNNSKLEIHLYWTGKSSTTSPTVYYGPLISAISVSPVPKGHKKKFSSAIISAIVGPALLLALMILGLCWKMGWLGGKRPNGVEVNPGVVFNFHQIKSATNDFDTANKIGQGGFGAVYKGILPNKTEIAVKRLSGKSKQGVREFINEVGTISALKHQNLVKLRGWCAEENQLLLVYEYMENNSLGHVLFGPGKESLDWKKRVKICLDVAKGLVYLHEECKLKLIHGDIKPTNILLDKDFNAKISDFGFARPDEDKNTPDNPRGTQGYIAPECTKRYSPKVDVYSFGILTLEIISGKQSCTPNAKGPTVYLYDMAHNYLGQKNPLALLDSSLGSKYDAREAKNIIHLAMRCIKYDPNERPTMSDVVKLLEAKKNIDAPIADDDSMIGKVPDFSQSIHSASTSFEGTSNSTISHSTGKEIDDSSL